ncbi:MAG: ABC transporter permease [Microscillaceae bacterium]|nr:ABC transporter permease [Microscillaceae bacterium]MDW8461465.1 ABC transporter permease [Cytophagales bacterium]
MFSPVFQIAFKHLFSKKRQTIVAILGVTFGITVFIFQAGLVTGLQGYFVEKTINTTAHIHIFNDTKTLPISLLRQYENYYAKSSNKLPTWIIVHGQKRKEENIKIKNAAQIVEILEKDSDVLGVSPSLTAQVLFKAGITQVGGRVVGVDIEKENLLFNLSKDIIAGEYLKLKTIPNSIILGSGLAEKMNVKLNENITVTSPKGLNIDAKVVAIIKTGITAVDDNRAFMKISTTQKLLEVESNFITDINIKLKNIDLAVEKAQLYQMQFGYRAENWIEANANVFAIFRIQNITTYLVIISILIVSGFGIFNILTMIIYEKMPDIAILKAVGYTNNDIRKIFLIEALFIGFVGSILGLVVGFTASKIASSIPFNAKGFVTLEYLNINFNLYFYLAAFCFGILSTFLAGYLPARKAAKVDPIAIIRGK